METVGNFPDLASAEIAAATLRGEGIECLIPDEHLVGVDWYVATAIQGVRLQVAPDDVEAAKALLVQFQTETEVDPSENPVAEAPPDEVCPRCKSDQIGPAKWRNRLKALGLFFPPVLLLWPMYAVLGPLKTCRHCGHEWR